MNVFIRKILMVLIASMILVSARSLALSQTDVIPTAIADLSSADGAVRYRAASVLCAATDDPRTVEPLIGALNDPDYGIRLMVTNSLGFHKDRRAVPALIGLLNDKTLQGFAASSLGMIGDTAAVEPLIQFLNNSDREGCNYPAIQALGQMHDTRAVMPLFSQIRKDCGADVARAIGPVGVEPMIEIVRTGTATDREYAAWTLSFIADERALDALISVLGVKENRVGDNASDAIALRIGSPAIGPLHSAFKGGDLELKSRVVLTLAKIDDDRAANVLLELVSQNENTVRRMVVDTLADFHKYSYGPKSDRVASALLMAMRDKDPEIRNIAIGALSWEQRTDVYQALVSALDDPATSAEASLVLGARKDLRAVPHLLAALKGDQPSIAARAAAVLTMIGEPAVDGLIAVLTDQSSEFPAREARRRQSRATAPLFFRCGTGPPDPVLDPRVLAATALGEIGDEHARLPLTAALKDKAEWLRMAAAAALEKLNTKK